MAGFGRARGRRPGTEPNDLPEPNDLRELKELWTMIAQSAGYSPALAGSSGGGRGQGSRREPPAPEPVIQVPVPAEFDVPVPTQFDDPSPVPPPPVVLESSAPGLAQGPAFPASNSRGCGMVRGSAVSQDTVGYAGPPALPPEVQSDPAPVPNLEVGPESSGSGVRSGQAGAAGTSDPANQRKLPIKGLRTSDPRRPIVQIISADGPRPHGIPRARDHVRFQLKCGHWARGYYEEGMNPLEIDCIYECGKPTVCKGEDHYCNALCGHEGPCSPCREEGCEPDWFQLTVHQTTVRFPIRVVKEGERSMEELIELAKGETLIMLEAGANFPSGLLADYKVKKPGKN